MKSSDELYLGWNLDSMLEITLKHPDDFLKVKETLTRIGVSSSRHANTIYQSCHILHKKGRYYIAHFKEMFMLDGRMHDFTVEDYKRRNAIAQLISDWRLANLCIPIGEEECASMRNIKIVTFADKKYWTLITKYSIGNTNKKSSGIN